MKAVHPGDSQHPLELAGIGLQGVLLRVLDARRHASDPAVKRYLDQAAALLQTADELLDEALTEEDRDGATAFSAEAA